MNKAELAKLNSDLIGMFGSHATPDEIEKWADAYTFSRRDVVALLRLLLAGPLPQPKGREFKVVFNVAGYVSQRVFITDPRVTAASLQKGLESGKIITTIHGEGESATVERTNGKVIGYVVDTCSKSDVSYEDFTVEE